MQLNIGRPLYSTKQHKRTNTRDYFKDSAEEKHAQKNKKLG